MFSTFVTFALLATTALGQLTVNTPVFTQCKDASISWSNGKGPYNLIVVNSNDPCGDALAELGDHNGNSMTWKVALEAGKKVEVSLLDANDNEAWTGAITVGQSDDTSCLSNKAVVQGSTSSASSNGQVSVAGVGSAPLVVVTPTQTVQVTPTNTAVSGSTGSSSSNSGLSGAVGGVGNAGANPLGLGNGALTMRQASTPVMVLGALAAILAASL